MLIFFVQMSEQAWHRFLNAMSSTALSLWVSVLVLPVGIVIASSYSTWRTQRKQGTKLKMDLAAVNAARLSFTVLAVVYGAIFAYQFAATIYQDHRLLEAGVQSTEQAKSEQRDTDRKQISMLEKTLQSDAVECAKADGQNETLRRQTIDQQTLIAGCQQDAIKRLTPAPRSVIFLFMQADSSTEKDVTRSQYLVLTDRTVTPVRMKIICPNAGDVDFALIVVGSSTMSGGNAKISADTYNVLMDSPAWSPSAPLLLTTRTHGIGSPACRLDLAS